MMILMMCYVHRAYLSAKKQLEEKRAQARSLRDQRDVSKARFPLPELTARVDG